MQGEGGRIYNLKKSEKKVTISSQCSCAVMPQGACKQGLHTGTGLLVRLGSVF